MDGVFKCDLRSTVKCSSLTNTGQNTMIITHKYILPSLILPLQSKQYEDEASAVVHLPHVDQRKRLWLDPRKAMHIVTVCQEVM